LTSWVRSIGARLSWMVALALLGLPVMTAL